MREGTGVHLQWSSLFLLPSSQLKHASPPWSWWRGPTKPYHVPFFPKRHLQLFAELIKVNAKQPQKAFEGRWGTLSPTAIFSPSTFQSGSLQELPGAVTPEVMLATPEATSGAAQLHKPPRKEGKELFAPL